MIKEEKHSYITLMSLFGITSDCIIVFRQFGLDIADEELGKGSKCPACKGSGFLGLSTLCILSSLRDIVKAINFDFSFVECNFTVILI